MARRPDPTALTSEEASKLRSLVRRIKTARRMTNEELAERLGWDPRRVTNAMSDSGPQGKPNRILAATADALFTVVSSVNNPRQTRKSTRVNVMLPPALTEELVDYLLRLRMDSESWLNRWKFVTGAPAVFIPPWEAERFANQLIGLIKKPGMNTRTVEMLRKALARAFRGGEASKWARSWYYNFAYQRGLMSLKYRPSGSEREVLERLVKLTFPARKGGSVKQ